MENKIDLSPEALQKRKEIAEKAYSRLDGYVMDHNNANSPTAVIAMIDEIECLRGEIEYYKYALNKQNDSWAVPWQQIHAIGRYLKKDIPIEQGACIIIESIAIRDDKIERLRSENHALKMEVQRLQIYEDDLK